MVSEALPGGPSFAALTSGLGSDLSLTKSNSTSISTLSKPTFVVSVVLRCARFFMQRCSFHLVDNYTRLHGFTKHDSSSTEGGAEKEMAESQHHEPTHRHSGSN
jgi:hypothetical protein